jgi:hypothetical protein
MNLERTSNAAVVEAESEDCSETELDSTILQQIRAIALPRLDDKLSLDVVCAANG